MEREEYQVNVLALTLFIFLFGLIYVGLMLKILLPYEIQDTSLANYFQNAFKLTGRVAGASTGITGEEVFLNSFLRIFYNFFINLVESVKF